MGYKQIGDFVDQLNFTVFCDGCSPGTCEFTSQRFSNAENVPMSRRHRALYIADCLVSGTPYKFITNTLC